MPRAHCKTKGQLGEPHKCFIADHMTSDQSASELVSASDIVSIHCHANQNFNETK